VLKLLVGVVVADANRARLEQEVLKLLNEAPLLESWYREYLDFSEYNISSSGVQPYSFKEIRQITGIYDAGSG
jgi:hypothetical protein